jgi:hypothetical protein
LDRKGEGTSGLFFMFIKIVKKKSPSLGPGAAVGVVAEVDSWDILQWLVGWGKWMFCGRGRN